MEIAFIPIDNRPVCYSMPQIITGIDSDIEFSIPERKLLGDLTKSAKTEELLEWLNSLRKQDSIILSLDTIAHGGLIPSRRSFDSFEEIKNRIEKLKKIKVYAFSSIMRISNNNCNDEEKEYWSKYGKEIFKYSYLIHKNGYAETSVPDEILKDYIETRKRNFEINKIYLEWQKEGIFDTLIFSKDDCAPYGFNVQEARELELLGGKTKTGADEIPLTLLSRALDKTLKVCPVFLEPEYKNLISNYEDISIENSVKSQLELGGCKITDEENADIILYVNNFKRQQGEIVMGTDTEKYSGRKFTPAEKPYMIADVRFANGSDNNFVEKLLENDINSKNFCGYSAWNTSANTLGSLICGAKYKHFAQKYKPEKFKDLQITRFLDDWAYQGNVRQQLRKPDTKELETKIKPFETRILNIFNSGRKIKYTFPWNRLFEVEVWIS